MDDRRFDALVRGLAAGRDRRSTLKTLLGLGAVAITSATLETQPAKAARRTTPTPTPPACPGSQHWDGNACVCPNGNTICGPACCPNGQAVCCDGACCHGACYGEELCCEDGFSVCQNTSCCPPGDVCLENGECCTPKTCGSEPPASLYDCGPSSDGCGGSLDCTCPENWLCISRDTGNFCANLTDQCIDGITAQGYGDIGLCAQAEGFCAASVPSLGVTHCVSLSTVSCIDCMQDLECGSIAGGVCVQSWSEVCSTQSMCAQALSA